MEEEVKSKIVTIGAIVAVGGGLGWFGWKEYKKWKAKHDASVEDITDTQAQPESSPPEKSSFPLKKGSRGASVKALQQALISKYGKLIMPKYGADGMFGSELEAALKKKGIANPVTEQVFNQITGNAVQGIGICKQLITTLNTIVWKSKLSWRKVPANTILGKVITARNGFTLFQGKDNRPYLVRSQSVKEIQCKG